MSVQNNVEKGRLLMEAAQKLGITLESKSGSYGDSATLSQKYFELLWPNGIPPERMGDSFVLGRIFDKIMRIANAPSAYDEDAWMDMAGYAIIGSVNNRKVKTEKPTDK